MSETDIAPTFFGFAGIDLPWTMHGRDLGPYLKSPEAEHSIIATIDWCSSPKLRFDARDCIDIVFACGSCLSDWRIFLGLFYITFRTREYLWMRRMFNKQI